MSDDTLAPWEISALKVTAGMLIRGVGGFEVAEMASGKAKATLHGYTDLRSPSFMPIDTLVRLERELIACDGRPIVSPLLARNVGCVQVPLPKSDGVVDRLVGPVVKEAAALAAQHVEAAADGRLTDAERAEGAAAADRLIALAMELRAAYAGPAIPLRARREAA